MSYLERYTNGEYERVWDDLLALGGASMKSNQLFGPYGNVRYYACCLNTAKGFIGQYNDGSGLDYLHARYYHPVVGVFLTQRLSSNVLIGDLLTPSLSGNMRVTKGDTLDLRR
jgi:uncharacterized protein RhaS with RHS repeats